MSSTKKPKKATGSSKRGTKKAKAKNVPNQKPTPESPALKSELRKLAQKKGIDVAKTKHEESLGTTGNPPKALPLSDFFIRAKVLEVGGDGKATDDERKQMADVFKKAFADQWAKLVK